MSKTALYKIESTENQSKQVKEKRRGNLKGEEIPRDSFEDLLTAGEESFSIGGICDKVACGADSGFQYFQVKAGNESPDQTALKSFLDSIDCYTLFSELFLTGNSFFEVIKGKGKKEKEMKAERFLLETIRITTDKMEGENGPYSYIHKSGESTVNFLYSDVLHFKLPNFRSKYYGKSKFYKTIPQVVLLANIDKYYTKLFDRGNIKTSLLQDVNNKLNEQQKAAIASLILDSSKGVDNAFRSLIVGTELKKIQLEDDINTEPFLAYREDLLQSICIGCNFPYELLVSDNSNRATAGTARKLLNENLVGPKQKVVLKQLKEFLLGTTKFDPLLIDSIAFNTIDVEDEKETMEVITGYKNAGVIDANEARELSPYNLEAREDGTELITTKQTNEAKAVQKIEKTVESRYGKYFSNKDNSHV